MPLCRILGLSTHASEVSNLPYFVKERERRGSAVDKVDHVLVPWIAFAFQVDFVDRDRHGNKWGSAAAGR